jgi:hypothetical protein
MRVRVDPRFYDQARLALLLSGLGLGVLAPLVLAGVVGPARWVGVGGAPAWLFAFWHAAALVHAFVDVVGVGREFTDRQRRMC